MIHFCAVMPETKQIVTILYTNTKMQLKVTGYTSHLFLWSCVVLTECVCALHVEYLVLLRCGDPGLDEESSLLAVSIREALLWSCFPADDSGLFTAPKTLADLGWRSERRREFDLDARSVQRNTEMR